MNNIELLAPAGDEDSFKAAVLAGADAIFFGVSAFNARQRATNISFENLSSLIKIAKSRNVKTYLTLNILIYDSEFNSMLETVSKAVACGIDAVIVQDFGILYAVKKFFPDLEIHASTQMTTHNYLQCEFLSKENVSQVNLSRELSLKELKPLVKLLNEKNIVAEIFVHGAYCISFSGQCYLSQYLYGEAGNRGACVQPCRREFCLNDNHNNKFITPFNLKDNCAVSKLEELKQLGNISLKIEGRIKNYDYVWAVTSEWKKKLQDTNYQPVLLDKVMNRSYSDDYLNGKASINMFTFGSKDHSYFENGMVEEYSAKDCIIKLSEEADEFDKILIKDKNNNFICSGTLAVINPQNKKEFKLKVNSKEFKKIYHGQKVFIQKDIIHKFNLTAQIKNLNIIDKKIDIEVIAKLNEKLFVKFIYKDNVNQNTGDGCTNQTLELYSNSVLVRAEKNPLTKEVLKEKLCSLGGTGFVLDKFIVHQLDDNLFLPLKELKELRRRAVEELNSKINNNSNKNVKKDCDNKSKIIPNSNFILEEFNHKEVAIKTKTAVIYDSIIDLESSIENAIQSNSVNQIPILEFPCLSDTEDFISKKEFVLNNKNVIPYLPLVIFDNEINGFTDLIDQLDSHRTIYTENTGLGFYAAQKNIRVIGGQHFNITNSFAVKEYSSIINGFVPSFEIPEDELESVLKNAVNMGMEIWYPENNKKLLMTSRQCLIKKLDGCTKENCDLDCIKNCSKKIFFHGKNKEELVGIKRPGFYTSIFAPKNNNSSIVNRHKKYFSVIIKDSRNF